MMNNDHHRNDISSTLQIIRPENISYSQCSVSSTTGYSGQRVQDWAYDSPYTIPIDVLENSSGMYTPFVNRRLYSARNHAPDTHLMMVKIHKHLEPVGDIKSETGALNVTFLWEEADEVFPAIKKRPHVGRLSEVLGIDDIFEVCISKQQLQLRWIKHESGC